ncbi:hypothetical protein [Deferribacter abyssi]|uniref:hypothetical protein n=1 Tax=Deferribacter abyssi TaxID=213806 RepID=UPI003C28D8FF
MDVKDLQLLKHNIQIKNTLIALISNTIVKNKEFVENQLFDDNEDSLETILERFRLYLTFIDHENIITKTFIRIYLPYGITKIKDNHFIFLNKEYNPLGLALYNTWVNYDNFIEYSFQLIDETILSVLYNKLFFYDELRLPWSSKKNFNEYIKKLILFLRNTK